MEEMEGMEGVLPGHLFLKQVKCPVDNVTALHLGIFYFFGNTKVWVLCNLVVNFGAMLIWVGNNIDSIALSTK